MVVGASGAPASMSPTHLNRIPDSTIIFPGVMATATVELWALFFVPLVVLATAGESSQPFPDFGTGSGERSCLSHAPPAPASQESTLASVQCHLACISLSFTESVREERDNDSNSTWPYYVLRTDNCTFYQQLEECHRGCLQRSANNSLSPPDCRDACYGDCTRMCGGATCHGGFCETNCNKTWCKPGCKDAYKEIKNAGDTSSQRPPNPVSSVRLQLNNTISEYSFDLTESAPNPIEPHTEPTGFIFKIQDTQSEWVTFVGKKSPRETISLAAYVCMRMAVSFAAVNKHGPSEYSPEINIVVDGDCTPVPGAIESLAVEAEVDMRLLFFGHAVLKISWDPPQQNADCLDHYIVEILPYNRFCGTEKYRSGNLNETSLTVQATNTSESLGFLPVVDCDYDINVYSIPGNQKSTAEIKTPPYILSTESFNLSCNRVPNDGYFSFYMNWTIPEQVAFITAIQEFEIWKKLVNADGNTQQDYTTQIEKAESNKTAYMIFVNDENMVPTLSDQSQYRLWMNVRWKNFTFDLQASKDIACPPLDATAPPPKAIKNFTLHSYCTHDNREIQLNFSWVPPTEIFGELTEYEVSIGPEVLTPREKVAGNRFLTSKISVDITSASWSTLFIYDTLYFQMRARSNWSVDSDWTEPKMITSAQLNDCTALTMPGDVENLTIKNLTLDSYCTFGDNEIQLEFSWVPPTGELTEYEVSIGPEALTGREEATANGFFTSKIAVNANISSASWSTLFAFNHNSDTLYLQMRAHSNLSVVSDWTEPEIITSVQLVGCMNISHAQQLGYVYGIAVGIIIVAVGLLILTILVYCHYKLRKRKRQLEKIMDESNLDPMFSMGPKKPIVKNPDAVLLADAWELPPSNVIIEECLGEGAFGEVFKGIIKGAVSNPKIRPSLKNAICATVAIKLLKPMAKGSERRDFLQEIEMMKKVTEGQNAHVVSMVGCITVQEPLCLVTEFVRHGDLLTYLRTNRKLHTGEVEDDSENPYYDLGSICPLDLISFAYQIASGMEYLSSLGIVHRDLACRNVLVDEGKVLKITDFGMSRETDEIYVQKTQGRVPLKWMAVESIIAREFTTASDVWSYGILLWEIGTLGGFPYPSIQNEDLLALLKSGYRMEKPNNCSPEVYDIMLECWNEEARKRPTFTKLRANFDAMLLDGHKDAYIDLQIDIEKPYYKKDQLQVSPALKRKSQLSIADVQVFRHEFEKSPSHHSASSLAQGSPLLPRVSFLGTSPSHELKSSRPTSMLVPRAPEHTQPMNPYVDDPSKLARTFATTLAVPKSPLVSRATSEGNLPASAEGGEGPTNIRITITPDP